MRMKKIISLILVGTMVISMCACAKKEAPSETAAPETTAAAVEKETTGMPNPMVEITDSAEFEKQLGIKIDASKLHSTPKMFIIDGKVADVIMNETNVDGNPVEYRLRATKDASIAPTMHGVNGDLVEVGNINMEFGDKKVAIHQQETADKKITLHTWQVDDTYYSLTIDNAHSQMQYAEIMDSIMLATGIDPSGNSANEEPIGMANPMVELTGEELAYKLGFSFKIPKGATDIKYFAINDSIAEARFKLDGIDFTARYKSASEFEDISGMYYDWTVQEDTEYMGRPAKFMRYIGDDGYVDVMLWYDFVPGVMCSLTAQAKDLDGFDIQAVADQMFIEFQGDDGATTLEDGSTRVGINTNGVVAHEPDEEIVECEIYTLVVLDEVTVKGLKKGGVIKLSECGLQDIEIEEIEKKSNSHIEINNIIAIEKNDELGGYTLRGADDDMVKFVSGLRVFSVLKDTKIDDQMASIAGDDNPCKSITEAVNRYGFFEATVDCKDGIASKVTIHYHP